MWRKTTVLQIIKSSFLLGAKYLHTWFKTLAPMQGLESGSSESPKQKNAYKVFGRVGDSLFGWVALGV